MLIETIATLLLLAGPDSAGAADRAPGMLVVVHESKMSKTFKLIGLRYTLDGDRLYDKTGQDDRLELIQREEIDRGTVTPGWHTLRVRMLLQGQGQGVFSYMRGYKFKVESRHDFFTEAGQTVTVTLTGFERDRSKLSERPAVRWSVQKDPPDKYTHPRPKTYTVIPGRKLPRFMAEVGCDLDYLFWADGTRFTWGWGGALGVRLFDRLYLKFKFTLPLFFLFFSAGNHESFGGELEYLFLAPESGDPGFSMGVKAGAGYNWHVNRHTQLFGPESPEPSQCASGLKTWAALRIGVSSDTFFGFLDLGLDLKRMDVKNRYAVSRGEWFVGPYFGTGAGGRF